MSQLLNRAAVGVVSGEEAGEILQAYITTVPEMIFNHTPQANPMPAIQPNRVR